jgi:hypothetical protein
MSSTGSSCDQSQFAVNPDISGIGVRCSFYLQTFLLVLLVDRSWEDAPSALWTFIATSFGLTVAALAQVTKNQLSLFQALQVSNLVWLANFGTFLALASYSRRKSRSKSKGSKGKLAKPENYVKFGAMFQTLLSMILTEWLWGNASTFGSQCSTNLQYVLFVVKVNALGGGRIVALTLTSLLIAGYIAVTYHELRSYYRAYRNARHHKNDSVPRSAEEKAEKAATPVSALSPNNLLPPNIDFSRTSSLTVPASVTTTASTSQRVEARLRHTKKTRSTKVRPRRKQWSGNWDPMLLGIAAFQIVVFTYFVVSSELLLRWNPHQSGGELWGFGQILSLIVIIPSALAVFNAFRAHGFQRLHRRRTNRKGKSKQPSPLDVTSAVDVNNIV